MLEGISCGQKKFARVIPEIHRQQQSRSGSQDILKESSRPIARLHCEIGGKGLPLASD
jgi:hypothetical protein